MANGKEVQAVVPASPAKVLPLGIESGDDAWRHASRLAKSGLVPDSLKGKPEDVMIVLMMGRRLGLEPDQSIQAIHVVKGKPVLSADLIVAQCLKHPSVCRYFVPTLLSSERVEYSTQRTNAPVSTQMVYTMEDAKRAGLTGKDTWKANPMDMLRARCASKLARAVYPDLVLGLYTPEEMDVDHEPSVVQAPRTLADLTTRMAQVKVIKEALPAGSFGHALAVEAEAIQAEEAAEIAAQERDDSPEAP